MPKLDIDIDFDELENAPDAYDGEIPRAGTVLNGYIAGRWWILDQSFIRILWTADGNDGELAEFNGCPFWDDIPFSRYGKHSFMKVFGITLGDIQHRTGIAEEDDNVGAPIEKIGKFTPDGTRCFIETTHERRAGQLMPRVARWLARPPQSKRVLCRRCFEQMTEAELASEQHIRFCAISTVWAAWLRNHSDEIMALVAQAARGGTTR